MADITMCSGEGCKSKQKCYRFTAFFSPNWQSMFVEVPDKDSNCKHFWPNGKKNDK